MSIDDARTIDFVSIADAPRRACLIIADHLPWSDGEHLEKLEDKLNAYRDFVGSGEIFDRYPEIRDLPLWIEVQLTFEPTAPAMVFLDTAKEIIEADGMQFSWRRLG